ncbi:hypothetical protein [Nocardioides mesophilus]|uniref:DUF4267 domain-containing protein n=1 Tax=Nocardioides mesophilus TaxID=433659 RepID=A0A7G9R8H7_9ACTN|nr:hypothetical protein [Nocardioides mesophilus]QNN51902.1 hypothetical protein H9L09_15410 [Nocardioides mesophilus]
MTSKPQPRSVAAGGTATTRLLLALRLGWGLLLLIRPGVAREVVDPGRRLPAWSIPVLRVLGVRHVAQALVTTARPTRTVFVLGAVSDALHALSAVGYAVTGRPGRSAALRDAAVAGGAGVAWASRARR